MRHSRGRGGRGRGRIGGSGRHAPQLPFKLRKELDDASGEHKPRKGSGSMFAVSRRKEERKAARHRGRGRGASTSGGRHADGFKPFTSRPEQAQESKPRSAAKRPAEQKARAPPAQKKTKFDELLGHTGPQSTSKEAFAAEGTLQRQLARKLGIKGKKRKAAPLPETDAVEELDTLFAEDGVASAADEDETDDTATEASTEDGGLLMEGLQSSSDGEGQQDMDGSTSASDDDDGDDDSEGTEERSGASSESDSGSDEETNIRESKHSMPVSSTEKYVPPAARGRTGTSAQGASERLAKRVKGLLNRLAEANVQPTVLEAAGLLQSEGRRPGMQALTQELLQAVAGGPRATDRFAAVTAAFVSGLAGTTKATEVVAFFLEAAASRMEAAVKAQDSLAAGNLVAVIAHLYGCKVVDAATVYSLLDFLQHRFSEQDVALIYSLLSIAGFQLRADDPAAMKDFVQTAHSRSAEVSNDGNLSTRAQVLLGLVLDIKNNRQRSQGTGGPLTISSVLSAGVLKWLRGCGAEEVQLRNLTWQISLQPNKKELIIETVQGLWWQPTAGSMRASQPGALAASLADAEGGAELLRLAAAQRMSTESRRAVFCVVMGSQDAVDASERLIRLPLKGEAQREVVRVTVECCLQEQTWNGYYAQLLGSLVRAVKGHRITLQFCLWDLIKQLKDEDVRRMLNLARLIATLIASKAIQITVLKVVNFTDVMSDQQLLFWRVMFEELLQKQNDDSAVQDVFSKFGGPANALSVERADLTMFLRRQIGPWLARKHSQDDVLLGKLRAAELGLSMAAAMR